MNRQPSKHTARRTASAGSPQPATRRSGDAPKASPQKVRQPVYADVMPCRFGDQQRVKQVADSITNGESRWSTGEFIRVDRSSRPIDPAAHRGTGYEWESLPTITEITARAYQLYSERAGQCGSFEEDWLRAEQELAPSCAPIDAIAPALSSQPICSLIDHPPRCSFVHRMRCAWGTGTYHAKQAWRVCTRGSHPPEPV